MYDHLVEGEWDLVEQNVGRKVGPSGVYETYIPSAPEGIGELDDELVWRVQFRKGYNRESLRGVTTLIEVVFDSSEIIDETRSNGRPCIDGERQYENAPYGHLPDHRGERKRRCDAAQVGCRSQLSRYPGGQIQVHCDLVQERGHAGLVRKRERDRGHQRRECEMLRPGADA
jgi:hypothetical protein